MRTFKRKIVDIDTSVNNISKYNNQLTFTGIKQSKNIYEVDQKSQMDTLNVYVNDENTLVSREPLVEDAVDIELDGELIDVKETNDVKVYVTRTETSYKIIAKRDNEIVELTATEYHLAIFNQYIICFRTEGAQVIDTNEDTLIWTNISNFAEVPITKIVTGNDVEDRDYNRFTNTIKEQYIITEDINTALPNEDPTSVEILKDNTSINIDTFKSPKELIDFRLYTTCNYSVNAPNTLSPSLITIHNNIVCIQHSDGFLLSRDYGQSFVLVVSPYTHTLLGPRLSDDGEAVFAITEQCVYRCSLSDYSWTTFYIHDDTSLYIRPDNYVAVISNYKFVNSETFMFMYVSYTNRRFYFKANNLYTDISYNNKLDYISLNDYINYPIRTTIREHLYIRQNFATTFDDLGNVCGCFTTNCKTSTDTAGVCLTFFTASESGIKYNSSTPIEVMSGGHGDNSKYLTITEISVSRSSTNERTIRIGGIDSYAKKADVSLYNASIKAPATGNNWNSYTFTNSTSINKYVSSTTVIIKLADGIYVNSTWGSQTDNYLIDIYNDKTYNVPGYTDKNDLEFNLFDLIIGNNSDTIYYIAHYKPPRQDTQIYTLLSTNLGISTAIFEYTKIDNTLETTINRVPTLSYSGSELFLAFNNTLMITKNTKDGSNILFNLPKINNQDFVDNITNMINISTTELAIFFKNNILICTRQSDETFGYVYTYNKTRLSLGVRLGDDVINTLDGANSIFPTIRGLAIMNYQAYMATTDQMLTFATDNINQLWNEFYSKSSNIKIIQMRNYIYLSNGTNEYLMFDTRTASWWKFEIPFAITKMLTNQLYLNIISSRLYKLDIAFDKNKYIDYDNNHINWYIVSQRLHFGVPNHYKNLKQLIFQLVQSNNFQNTINTEIKLYRKTITYKEPEMIKFKIDEFKTVVKRFNYWKINELQWALSSDNNTNIPAQLILNGIDIKYEIGEEVR